MVYKLRSLLDSNATDISPQVKVLAVLYKGGKWAKEEPRLLGTIENQLGLREWLESQGHTFVVTDDKEGENSTLDREIVDAEIVITTPFHPGYITRERIEKAKNLKVCITAGVGTTRLLQPRVSNVQRIRSY
jgi:formate dehydrogenase